MHPSTAAVSYETVFTSGPVDDGSDWATDEATTTADRLHHFVVEPDAMRIASIEDERLVDFITESRDPISGLRNFEGVPFEIALAGSEEDTAATTQVTETGVMRFWEHFMGGVSRGYTSAITLVGSQTAMDPTTPTGLDAGIWYAQQDDDDTTQNFPARVIVEDGTTATFDRAPPFTITTSDLLKAMAVFYIDEAALSNPNDANVNTISLLVVKGGIVWEAVGCRFEPTSIQFPRGAVPRLVGTISGAYVRAPGDGAPAEPVWTGAIQGEEGRAVGTNHKLYMQNVGTTTLATYDVVQGSAVLNFGLPRPPQETGTEDTDRAQGIAGFGLGKGDTIFEVQVFLATEHQDDWNTKQSRIVSYYHHGEAGKVWVTHIPNATLMEPPQRVGGQESNLFQLRLKGKMDRSLDATASNLARARSRVQIAMG
jgi:hypothetical protein